MKRFTLFSFLVLTAIFLAKTTFAATYAETVAHSPLTGVVKSQGGQPLEGILIRAKEQGSHIAITVVSNAHGVYRFPKLKSGSYKVETARADGMEPVHFEVFIQDGRVTHQNFTLKPAPAKEWDQYISARDWLLDLPPMQSAAQKSKKQGKLTANNLGGAGIEECVYCHATAVRKHRFSYKGWLKIVKVMTGQYGNLLYQNWGMPEHAQERGAVPDPELPGWHEKASALAHYLAKIRGPKPFIVHNPKIEPRQTGRATRVIYTEYDIPYQSAEPHDVAVAKDGMVFWGDWRWGILGQLNPKTGAMKTWVVHQTDAKSKLFPGIFQIAFDKDDNPWSTIVWQGGLVKLDRKTGILRRWTFPDSGRRRCIMTSVDKSRNRVWFETDNYYGKFSMAYYKPNLHKWVVYDIPFEPGKRQDLIYGHVLDSKGNVYMLMMLDDDIDRLDAVTGKLTVFPIPTKNAFPRRGDYDSKNRIWFAEYHANQIGMLDPATGKFTEYKLPPLARPYSTNVDRRTGLVWTAEFLADAFVGFNPKTGVMREYALPTFDSEVRIIASHSVGDHTVLWYGSMSKYSGGKIVKMEVWW